MTAPYDTNALLQWRAERDHLFLTHYSSPLPEEHLPSFKGLSYFEPDPAFELRGRFAPVETTLEIASSTGGVMGYPVAGYMELAVGDQTAQVVVLHGEEGEMFTPFRDSTCESESYNGGRYAPVVVTGPGEATVDFNRAVNPYCAYDEEFSCPRPPTENWLQGAVRAGEKGYNPD